MSAREKKQGESVIDVGLGGMTLPRDVLHSHQKSCICSVQSLLEFLRECPGFGSIEYNWLDGGFKNF